MSGAGSHWQSANGLSIGYSGTGSLAISNGGKVSGDFGYVAYLAGSTGGVTVTGTDSLWENATSLSIGNEGTGTILIENGGRVTSGHTTFIGLSVGSNGTATITGAESTWEVALNMSVGSRGTGTLTISDGAEVSAVGGYVGSWDTGHGTATVTGSGSRWTNSSTMIVGSEGVGLLTIENGGAVSNTAGTIGDVAGSTGTVVVSGAGSLWSNSDSLTVGAGGDGTLTVSNGGVVRAADGTGTLTIAEQSGSAGTVNIGAYDLLNPTTAGVLDVEAVVFGSGSGVLNFNQTDAIVFEADISGDGGVIHRGTGVTNLLGVSTYTGPTTVVAGTLVVDGSITSAVTVKGGATFGGDGIVGDITLESGAILTPVDCLDGASLVWNPGATLVFSLGDGASDELGLSGALTRNDDTGVYAFSFLDDGWEAGQTYTLILFDSTNFAASDFSYTNGGGFHGNFAIVDQTLQFTLIAVPKPSVIALGFVVILGLTIRRRIAARSGR